MFFILALTLHSLCFGQDILEAIEVGATKDLEESTFSNATVVSSFELESGPHNLLSSKLESVPGVVAAQNGGPGGRVSYFIRGTESRHVSFFLDGMKLNDPSNTDRQFDAAFVTSSFLREVVVHKGPQAVMYGSDAFGGLVEMISRKGENAPEARLSLRGGSFGTSEVSLAQDWLSGTSQGSLTWNQFRTDGISRLNQKRFGASERDGAEITHVTSSSTHFWRKHKTDLLLSFLEGANELDGNLQDNADESRNRQQVFQQRTGFDLGEFHSLTLRNGISLHDRLIETEDFGNFRYNGSLLQNELIHRFTYRELSLLSGLQSEKESLKLPQITEHFWLNSIYLQGTVRFENWKLHSGLRQDDHSSYGAFTVHSTGLAWEWEGATLSLQYAQGYKAPSLYQLHAPPISGPPIGNPDLTPEENDSWEARWEQKHAGHDFVLALFQNRLSSLIDLSPRGFVNQVSYVAEGLELSSRLRGDVFELRPSFTHQSFRNTPRVLRRPENFGQLTLIYFPVEAVEGQLRGRWFDARWDQTETRQPVRLAGFSVVDLGFKFTHKNREYGVDILNLLDRHYEEIYGFSVMPRSIFVSFAVKFSE